MTRSTLLIHSLIAATALGLGGCGLFGKKEDKNRGYGGDTLVDPEVNRAKAQALPPVDNAFTVEGMVGQVNGKPIYADYVFEGTAEPIDAQLAASGRRLARAAFRGEAREVIVRKLREIVLDALILAEAERDLSEGERAGLKAYMQKKEDELIRQYGQGSLALAEANILEQTGTSLQQTLQDLRRRIIVERYLRETIDPRVHVSRRDVIRYYEERTSEYQPEPTRTLRLIQVTTAEDAATIAARLTGQEDFQTVAGSELNQNFPASGGLFGELVGKRPLREELDPVNDAIQPLAEGQWAGPITVQGPYAGYWFVYVEKLDQPPVRTLMDAQLEIETTLRNQQFRIESARYQEKLMLGGSYTPFGEMADALVEIALSRYGVAEDAGGAEGSAPNAN